MPRRRVRPHKVSTYLTRVELARLELAARRDDVPLSIALRDRLLRGLEDGGRSDEGSPEPPSGPTNVAGALSSATGDRG